MGAHHDARHRQALLQQFTAELLRESRDAQSLEITAHRILTHPDVSRDAELSADLRSLVAERRAEVRARVEQARSEDRIPLDVPPRVFERTSIPAPPPPPTPTHLLAAFERLKHDLDDRLANFDLLAAAELLRLIRETRERHPELIPEPVVRRCESDVATVQKRRAEFDAEIETLRARAVEAARGGRTAAVAQALKRLSAICAARPTLLPEPQLERIRAEINENANRFERAELTEELVRREKAVAVEIRRIAASVHAFHDAIRLVPHDDERFRAAERDYRAAIDELRHHDKEWLADLMVELDDLLEQVHDPTGKAEAHVNRFLDSVRETLQRVIVEIREIRREIGPPPGTIAPLLPRSSPAGPPDTSSPAR